MKSKPDAYYICNLTGKKPSIALLLYIEWVMKKLEDCILKRFDNGNVYIMREGNRLELFANAVSPVKLNIPVGKISTAYAWTVRMIEKWHKQRISESNKNDAYLVYSENDMKNDNLRWYVEYIEELAFGLEKWKSISTVWNNKKLYVINTELNDRLYRLRSFAEWLKYNVSDSQLFTVVHVCNLYQWPKAKSHAEAFKYRMECTRIKQSIVYALNRLVNAPYISTYPFNDAGFLDKLSIDHETRKLIEKHRNEP